MTKEELKRGAKEFAVRVFKLMLTFEKSKASEVISYQLLRSASSVTVNYRASCRGKSSSDFLNKLKVVDEEADESLFWLEMIRDLAFNVDKKELDLLLIEANELVSIFSAAIRTIKAKSLILNP